MSIINVKRFFVFVMYIFMIVCCASMSVMAEENSQYYLSDSVINDIDFKFTQLKDNQSADNVIFTYYNIVSFDNVIVKIESEKGEVFQQELSEKETFAEFKNLNLDESYRYSVEINGSTIKEGDLNSELEYVTYNNIDEQLEIENPEFNSVRATGQTFRAYYSSGSTAGSSTNSLFKAIEDARKAGTNAYVLMNCSQKVFEMSSTVQYYMYQFDQYYGATTSLTTAKQWMTNYNYAHVINNEAYPLYDSIYSIKGNLTATSANAYIEHNVGSYYYNISTGGSYKKISIDCDLSAFKFKRADSDKVKNNFYIFLASRQSTGICEFGLIMSGTGSATTISPYYKPANSSSVIRQSDTIATGTKNSSGVISFTDTIRLTYGISSGQMICTAQNLTTGTTLSYTFNVSSLSGTSQTTWVYAVSSPPIKSSNALNDLRSGAYAITLRLFNAKLYNSTTSSAGVSIAPSTSLCQYAFVYNTDCGAYSKSGSGSATVETIALFYDSLST